MAHLGQHFLKDQNYLERIVEAADIEADDRLLEIGPGHGELTEHLLDAGARVVAIELDRGLALRLRQRFEDPSPGEFHLIEGDAAQVDWPAFDKLVSNLPYQISSPVLFRLLETDYSQAVITVQREFGERVTARPGDGNYSRLSVKTQLRARTELLFRIPPGAFQPPPEVDSCCIRLTPQTPPEVHDWDLLEALIDQAFTMRRKMLRRSLRDQEEAVPVLEAMELETRRPAKLTPDQWVQVANHVAEARRG